MDRLKLAVVGAGGIAQRNAAEAVQSGAAAVVGVFDVNFKVARDMATRLGVRTFNSYAEALGAPGVEAVLLSVPHHLHKEMTLQAAAAGKHVLLEKPMATTLADADEIIAGCRRAGVVLTVNYSFRYLPKIQKARELVQGGALGDIVGVQVVSHQFKDMGYWMGARSNSPDDWRASRKKSGGGFLIMNVCHTIDYLYFITGLAATRVYSEYATLGSPGDVEDIVGLTCRWGDRAIGTISASSIMRGVDQGEERIWGTKGTLILGAETLSFWSTRPIDGRRPGQLHTYKRFTKVSWTAEWVRRFVTAIRTGSEPDVTARDGWSNLAFIETAYRSLEAGAPLDIPESAL